MQGQGVLPFETLTSGSLARVRHRHICLRCELNRVPPSTAVCMHCPWSPTDVNPPLARRTASVQHALPRHACTRRHRYLPAARLLRFSVFVCFVVFGKCRCLCSVPVTFPREAAVARAHAVAPPTPCVCHDYYRQPWSGTYVTGLTLRAFRIRLSAHRAIRTTASCSSNAEGLHPVPSPLPSG